jgi:hypothetical protein
MHATRSHPAVLVWACLTLGAFSGSPAMANGAQAPGDACSPFTAAQVSAALGIGVSGKAARDTYQVTLVRLGTRRRP